jgi:hypothetical protein
MKLGIGAAFGMINAAGGINGPELRLIAADDGYRTTGQSVRNPQRASFEKLTATYR